MEITKSKLSNYILYSHKNVGKLVENIINETCNAVLLEMFDDKLLLADVNTGKIYMSDYDFDGTKIHLENFEPVDIIENDEELRESVSDYFDADGNDTASLVEAYENQSAAMTTELSESIVSAVSKKRTDSTNYSELVGINEEIGEIKNSKFFKKYVERLSESPMDSLKIITWDRPVTVSIIDEDQNASIFLGSKDKAKKLLKEDEFKKAFLEAVKKLDENSLVMEDLVSNNIVFAGLTEGEIKEFVGLSIVGDKELMTKRKEITQKILNVISENEQLNEARELFLESDDGENSDKPDLSIDEKDVEALKSALDKALEKITDEKLVEKINSLKDALEATKDVDTTDVATVKECVELLSL